MFSHEFRVKLRHTDAAGVAFFASYFGIAHDVYELALEQAGAPLADWLEALPMPLAHSEADYYAPLCHGERARVELGVERIGGRSFSLVYTIWVTPSSKRRWRAAPPEGAEQGWVKACRLKTVHVAVDPQSGATVELPSLIKEALERIGPPSLEGPP